MFLFRSSSSPQAATRVMSLSSQVEAVAEICRTCRPELEIEKSDVVKMSTATAGLQKKFRDIMNKFELL